MQSRDADYLREVAVRCDRLARACQHDRTKRELEELSLELADKAIEMKSDFTDPAMIARKAPTPRLPLNLTPLEASLALVALCTVVLLTIDSLLKPGHLIFGFLAPVLFIAARYGGVSALLASLASDLSAMFFLYPPKFSIYVAEQQNFVELFFFSALALLATQFIISRANSMRARTPPSET